MKNRYLVSVLSAALVLSLAGITAASDWIGHVPDDPQQLPITQQPIPEVLFKGVFSGAFIGCNLGPNDWAQGVTATLNPPPLDVLTHAYDLGTNAGVTQLTFAVWTGGIGAPPGAQICAMGGLPFTAFTPHTVPVIGCKITAAQAPGGHFYFGQNQPQSPAYARWGYDSGGIPGDAWIRAPGCGAFSFTPLTAVVFPGAWNAAVVVDAQPPVDVENFSWGAVKAKYQ